MINPSQWPLPDNTQHSQQTNIHAPTVGIEPTISAGERPKTYALDRTATGTGTKNYYINKFSINVLNVLITVQFIIHLIIGWYIDKVNVQTKEGKVVYFLHKGNVAIAEG